MGLSRRRFVRLGGAGVVGLAGCSGTGGDGSTEPAGGSTAQSTPTDSETATAAPDLWRTTPLTDVLTGESFVVDERPGPVLLHTFATWCPVCERQHSHLDGFDPAEDVTIVSLNVDPNEDAQAVREYAAGKNLDWRFVIAAPEVTESLKTQFGTTILNPPSAPIVVACPGGEATLLGQSGVKSPQYLREHIDC